MAQWLTAVMANHHPAIDNDDRSTAAVNLISCRLVTSRSRSTLLRSPPLPRRRSAIPVDSPGRRRADCIPRFRCCWSRSAVHSDRIASAPSAARGRFRGFNAPANDPSTDRYAVARPGKDGWRMLCGKKVGVLLDQSPLHSISGGIDPGASALGLVCIEHVY